MLDAFKDLAIMWTWLCGVYLLMVLVVKLFGKNGR